MVVAAVLCLCAAVVTAALGVWSLTRPAPVDYVQLVLRGVAPIQLAAGAMLAAGAVVGLAAAASTAVVVLGVCVAGAVATLAAGCWQSAKAVSRENARKATGTTQRCGEGSCATCTLSCG